MHDWKSSSPRLPPLSFTWTVEDIYTDRAEHPRGRGRLKCSDRVHACKHACTCVCTCSHVHTHLDVSLHLPRLLYVRVCVHASNCACMYACMFVYECTRLHLSLPLQYMHARMRVCMYAPGCKPAPPATAQGLPPALLRACGGPLCCACAVYAPSPGACVRLWMECIDTMNFTSFWCIERACCACAACAPSPGACVRLCVECSGSMCCVSSCFVDVCTLLSTPPHPNPT